MNFTYQKLICEKIRRPKRLGGTLFAFFLVLAVFNTAFADTPVTLFQSFAGNINITGTAGTLRTQADPNSCTVTNSGTMTLSGLPAGASVVKAYLYWAGSGGDPAGGNPADYNVTFNGINLTADRTYTASYNNGGNMLYFFGGAADVSAYVTGNGTYTFANLTVQNADVGGGGSYCSSQAVLSAFALVVIYSHPDETRHIVNLWEGFQTYRGSAITLTPSNFIIPDPVPANSARHLVLTWEGDFGNSADLNGYSENLTFCAPAPCTGTALTDAYNPANNQFNSTVDIPPNGPFSGIDTTWGVDLDLYDITGYLHVGDSSAQAVYSSGGDLVILMNQTMSIPSVEVADLAITKSHSGSFLVGETGYYVLRVANNGPDATSGSITVTDTLPSGLTYAGATGNGWSCGASGQTVTCSRSDSLAMGEIAPDITLAVSVGAAAYPSVTNTATVSGALFDNVSGNNSSSDLTYVQNSGTGNKPLYIQRTGAATGSLNRTPQAVSTNYVSIAKNTTVQFPLNPALQSAVTINSQGSTIPVRLWLSTNNNRTYSMTLTLRCGSTQVATVTGSAALTGAVTAFSFNLPDTNYTCSPPNTWRFDIRNNENPFFVTADIRVYPSPSSGNYSNVNLPSQSIINVDSVSFYDAAYPGGSAVTTVAPGQTVYVRAAVSDPFGSYDIHGATLTMIDPSENVRLNAAAMTQVYDSGAAGKIYEYVYTIPTGAGALGNWKARVAAAEGTEGTVSDYEDASLPVALASLSILKTADKSTVASGDIITYSILVTNTGNGPATSVSIDDALGPYIQWGLNSYPGGAFDLTQGSVPSGLTLGTPVYYSGASVYTPVSGGGGAPAGYDGNVTRFVLPLTGTMNGNGASFTVHYKVRVK